MRTQITLKLIVIAFITMLGINVMAQVPAHGSMKGDDVALCADGVPVDGQTVDYKIVTIGDNTWAWFKTNGGKITQGATWGAQLRYWTVANANSEKQTDERYSTETTTEALVKAESPTAEQTRISFFAVTTGSYDTDKMAYDPAAKNSAVADTEAPVINEISIVTKSRTSVTISIDATDNDDLFYYVTGEDGFEEVIFRNVHTFNNLTLGESYTFQITPVDFTGNAGTAQTLVVSPEVMHGTLKGDAVALYPESPSGGNVSAGAVAETLDFKVVTIEDVTWVWTKVYGGTLGGADWASQLRFWNSQNAGKLEIHLNKEGNTSSGTNQVRATDNQPYENGKVSIFQAVSVFSETVLYNYVADQANSKQADDVITHTINNIAVALAGTTATFTVNRTATDDASDFYYHVTGEDYNEVFFTDVFSIEELTEDVNYTFNVTIRDFSGNKAAPVIVNTIETSYSITITDGTAKINDEPVTEALENDVVTIEATIPAGYTFNNWIAVSENVTFDNANNSTTTFIMPAGNVEIAPVFAAPYTLTDATTASGTAVAGTVVNIEAPASKGDDNNEIFQNWEVVTGEGVVIADPQAASTSFTMIADPVTIKAVYKTIYNISVTGGAAFVADVAADKAYAETVVTVRATVPSGYKFVNWTSTSGVTFANADNAETTFTMPAANVTVTAEFELDTPNSINDVQQDALMVYPNPATDYIQATVSGTVNYAIYSITGEIVMQGTTNGYVSVNSLPQGMYIFAVDGKTCRFIKK